MTWSTSSASGSTRCGYDQYVANANGRPALQDFWRETKRQTLADISRLKHFIAEEIKKGCF